MINIRLSSENSTALQYIDNLTDDDSINSGLLCYLITHDLTKFLNEDIPEFEACLYLYKNHCVISKVVFKDLFSGNNNRKTALGNMVRDLLTKALKEARLVPIILPKCYYIEYDEWELNFYIEFLQKEYI